MLIFERECTIYRALPENVVITSFKLTTYEELKKLKDNLYEYIWFDPIKLKDKIISKNRKNVMFTVISNSYIVFFSNSESDIFYVTSRIHNQFNITLTKVDLFGFLKEELKNNTFFGDVYSLYIKNTLGDHEFLKEIPFKNDNPELLKYLDSGNVYSLSCRCKKTNMHFFMDSASVLSFHDNDTLEEIIDVLECFVLDY